MQLETDMSLPYAGKEFTFHNPNGTEFKVRGWGDQSNAIFETLDGYTVVKDPLTGFYHYATLSPDNSSLVPTDVPVGGVAEPETLGLQKGLRAQQPVLEAPVHAEGGILSGQSRWQIRRELKRSQIPLFANTPGAAPDAAPATKTLPGKPPQAS